ncbi:MAG: IS66 family insertion sequence element accessory protein TnpB [Hyalangium sp.]|uniref:IS66 family insertion sequence element accessory protein TnpB n=1 Tax=Hyalangium sp. TaxID=2028555 RepID=UPI00389A10A5
MDIHKGFDGPAALVEHHLGGQFLKGDVFLFVGRCRRRAKVQKIQALGRLMSTTARAREEARQHPRSARLARY